VPSDPSGERGQLAMPTELDPSSDVGRRPMNHAGHRTERRGLIQPRAARWMPRSPLGLTLPPVGDPLTVLAVPQADPLADSAAANRGRVPSGLGARPSRKPFLYRVSKGLLDRPTDCLRRQRVAMAGRHEHSTSLERWSFRPPAPQEEDESAQPQQGSR